MGEVVFIKDAISKKIKDLEDTYDLLYRDMLISDIYDKRMQKAVLKRMKVVEDEHEGLLVKEKTIMNREVKLFVAMKAFIVFGGNILIIRESSAYEDGFKAGEYDVVGGRVKPGERFDTCLLREIKEECGLDVVIDVPFHVDEWRFRTSGDEEWQIVGTFFRCEAFSDNVKTGGDHDDFKWIPPFDYKMYPLYDGLDKVFESYIETFHHVKYMDD
ncbi:MAG: NUDIX domain-containing protein [bacterium]|nr:NUDIX domain-containing protein [bacterium]